jgi:hypothetical protein
MAHFLKEHAVAITELQPGDLFRIRLLGQEPGRRCVHYEHYYDTLKDLVDDVYEANYLNDSYFETRVIDSEAILVLIKIDNIEDDRYIKSIYENKIIYTVYKSDYDHFNIELLKVV